MHHPFAIVVLAGLAVPALGQTRVLVADRAANAVWLMDDINGNGVIDEPSELWQCFNATNAPATANVDNPNTMAGRGDGLVADETVRGGPIRSGADPQRTEPRRSDLQRNDWGRRAGRLAGIDRAACRVRHGRCGCRGRRPRSGRRGARREPGQPRHARSGPWIGHPARARRWAGLDRGRARRVDVHGSCRESTGGQASRRDADRRRNTAPRPSVGRGDLEGVLVRRGFGPGSVSRVKRISGAHRVALPASVRWTEAGSRFYRQNRRSASRA